MVVQEKSIGGYHVRCEFNYWWAKLAVALANLDPTCCQEFCKWCREEALWDMLCKVISGLGRVCEDFLSAMSTSIGFSNAQVLWFQNWDVGTEDEWEQRLSNVLHQENGWLSQEGGWFLGPPEATQQWKKFQGRQLWSSWIDCSSRRGHSEGQGWARHLPQKREECA